MPKYYYTDPLAAACMRKYTLDVRCCCKPGVIKGQIVLDFSPEGECDIITNNGVVHIRRYVEIKYCTREERQIVHSGLAAQIH